VVRANQARGIVIALAMLNTST